MSDAWPAPATNHRPFCEHCCGPALDTISIRATAVCVPLQLCAGSRQHTDCAVPSLLLKPGNTPYPCPASEARAPVCPTWLTKQLWPLCSWSRVGGYINTFLCCCVRAADGSLLCSPEIYHLDSSNIKNNTKYRLGGSSIVTHTAYHIRRIYCYICHGVKNVHDVFFSFKNTILRGDIVIRTSYSLKKGGHIWGVRFIVGSDYYRSRHHNLALPIGWT